MTPEQEQLIKRFEVYSTASCEYKLAAICRDLDAQLAAEKRAVDAANGEALRLKEKLTRVTEERDGLAGAAATMAYYVSKSVAALEHGGGVGHVIADLNEAAKALDKPAITLAKLMREVQQKADTLMDDAFQVEPNVVFFLSANKVPMVMRPSVSVNARKLHLALAALREAEKGAAK